MIVSAHQPHYLPWIGYFNKIYLSDVFICMDNMNFTNSGFINRNRILTKNGILYLTVPLLKPYGINTKINELIIENESQSNWKKKHLKSIEHNYSKGIGFNSFYPILEKELEKPIDNYFDFQFNIIKTINQYLNINTKMQLGSTRKTGGIKESELILSILETSECDTFLFGLGASNDYVNKDIILDKGFKFAKQKFNHPYYKQNNRNFEKGLSIIDCLLRCSKDEAEHIVKQSGKINNE